MHERDAVLRARAGQQRGAHGIGAPAGHTTLRGLRTVHGGVGTAINHGAIEGPVVAAILGGIREVELVDVTEIEAVQETTLPRQRSHGTAELAVAARDERALGRHGNGVGEHGVVLVSLGERALRERDRPLDRKLGVGQVHEGVGLLELGRPMSVHKVGVGSAVLERLEGVAHATRDINCAGRVERAGEDAAKGLTRPQVHPSTKDRARRDRNELVPGLGVNPSRNAALGVEGDVVLHRSELGGQAGSHHLRALPVLLEPAARVTVHGQIQDNEPGNAGLRGA